MAAASGLFALELAMATMSAKKRDKLPAKAFAGPDRSYPVNDRAHAANAKARATQAVNAGRMSGSEKAKIDAKADKVLGESPKRGERTAKHKATK
ncbi:hypothetical protein [Burkholderia sp. Bp9031]|uniref:hypothetical protein n=1 Tax=Burkholderia sp. Bp9031 TaxID=2184566 RepID=UPI001C89C178|nr:hypothetical protein [Burkholderia sp. Bp9031]